MIFLLYGLVPKEKAVGALDLLHMYEKKGWVKVEERRSPPAGTKAKTDRLSTKVFFDNSSK